MSCFKQLPLLNHYQKLSRCDVKKVTQFGKHFAVKAVHLVIVVAIQGCARDTSASTYIRDF